MRMLVLGAGLQGSACAYDLLQNPDVTEVRLADLRVDTLAPFLAREGARCRWPVDMAEAGHWCCGADTGDVAVSYCRAHANLSKSKDTRIKTGRAYERSLRRYAA